jgi:hypothetical protein
MRNAYQRFPRARQKTRSSIRRVESGKVLCAYLSSLSITTCGFWRMMLVSCLHVMVNTNMYVF